MKAMNGFDIFEKMTNVNDKFIEEAAEMPSPASAAVKTSRWERFSHFINSGWGVAMICGIVAIGVMAGILAASRAGGPEMPPIIPGGRVEETSENRETHRREDPTENPGTHEASTSEAPTAEPGSDETIPEDTEPPMPTRINSEEEAIAAAKRYLQNLEQEFLFPLDSLTASAHLWQGGGEREYWVTFTYVFAGIETHYRLYITVTPDVKFKDFRESPWEENSYLLDYTEEEVKAALSRIKGGGMFWLSYEDGKLYVCSEEIVEYPPKIPGDSGCGIDHDHIFYKEEVLHTEN